jgi:hypothetical protein
MATSTTLVQLLRANTAANGRMVNKGIIAGIISTNILCQRAVASSSIGQRGILARCRQI